VSILGIIASSKLGVPAGAYESIASATGTGSSATITFSSIPSTYQHLQILYLVGILNTSEGFRIIYLVLRKITTR
jgi:hypothetical protein